MKTNRFIPWSPKSISGRTCTLLLVHIKSPILLCFQKFKIRIEDPPRRKHLVFLGGAVLADVIKDRDESWITKAEYDEMGVRCIDKLTGGST